MGARGQRRPTQKPFSESLNAISGWGASGPLYAARHAAKHSVENATWRSNTAAIDGDSPIDAPVLREARFRARFYWVFDGVFYSLARVVAAKAGIGLPGVETLGFPANQPWPPVPGLLNRSFANATAMQIETAVATASAERLSHIANRGGQSHATLRVAANLPHCRFGKLGHSNISAGK
jgi:hypothetical protein